MDITKKGGRVGIIRKYHKKVQILIMFKKSANLQILENDRIWSTPNTVAPNTVPKMLYIQTNWGRSASGRFRAHNSPRVNKGLFPKLLHHSRVYAWLQKRQIWSPLVKKLIGTTSSSVVDINYCILLKFGLHSFRFA